MTNQDNAPFISVLMPVYNSERFVEHAVESILRQDYADFELLLIDDGSTDGSGALCDRIAETDSRVKTFHKENGGMCGARNFGMKHARGTYIGFCDNDDEYLPHLLRDNCKLAQETAADVIRFGRRLEIVSNNGEKLSSDAGPKTSSSYSGKSIFENYEDIRGETMGVWNGLYRREFLLANEITFDERLRHGSEDTLFNIAAYSAANSIATNRGIYYNWIRRMDHSSSLSVTDDFILGIKLATEREDALMRNHGVIVDNPAFYAKRITRYLMDPLEATLLTDKMSYKAVLPLLKELKEVFSPFRKSVLSCPQPASRKLFFASITAGRFHLAYAAMVLSRQLLRLRAN